jgi:prophage maintenance system killer protein
LRLNGFDINGPEAERLKIWLDLASGQISEEELAAWFRRNIRAA